MPDTNSLLTYLVWTGGLLCKGSIGNHRHSRDAPRGWPGSPLCAGALLVCLACRCPAYFSTDTVKEKKLGTFKTMPSWVTMICLCFYFYSVVKECCFQPEYPSCVSFKRLSYGCHGNCIIKIWKLVYFRSLCVCMCVRVSAHVCFFHLGKEEI